MGRGAVALIEGPAGIGKTAMMHVAARLGAERGFGVRRASGGLLERELAWNVVRQLFAPLLTASEPARETLMSGASVGEGWLVVCWDPLRCWLDRRDNEISVGVHPHRLGEGGVRIISTWRASHNSTLDLAISGTPSPRNF
jgi:hypothetical protein